MTNLKTSRPAALRAIIFLCLMAILTQNVSAWDIPDELPSGIADRLRNTPQDALVSIGFSRLDSSIALGSAASDILAKRNGMVWGILANYGFQHEAARGYLFHIFNNLLFSGLFMASYVSDNFPDMEYWALVILNRSDFIGAMNRAAAAANAADPATTSFDFMAQVNAAYDRLILQQRLDVINRDDVIRGRR